MLNTRTDKQPPTEVLIKMLEFILKNNNFMFNNAHYVQQQGTAMGSRCAPNYANIFMDALERELLDTSVLTPEHFFRFIDDIFSIWLHGEAKLIEFIDHLNSFHPTIKFTANYSSESIDFLDVTVKVINGQLHTELFKKDSDTNNFLQHTSCHPKHTKNGIPYSQALRLKRICSTNETFEHHASNLKKHLVFCGYNKEMVSQNIESVAHFTQEDLLQVKTKQNTETRITLVTTYNPSLPNLHTLMKELWPICQVSPCFKDMPLPMVAYKRASNLQDQLVRARMPNKTPSNSTSIKNFFTTISSSTAKHKIAKCNTKNCTTCKFMPVNSTTFTSTNTGKTYNLKDTFTCRSENIVYVIQCKKHNVQYCGETETPLRLRFANHRASINCKYNYPVANHFKNNHEDGDLMVIPIEQIKHQNRTPKAKSIRRKRESFWIHELGSLEPMGMNINE